MRAGKFIRILARNDRERAFLPHPNGANLQILISCVLNCHGIVGYDTVYDFPIKHAELDDRKRKLIDVLIDSQISGCLLCAGKADSRSRGGADALTLVVRERDAEADRNGLVLLTPLRSELYLRTNLRLFPIEMSSSKPYLDIIAGVDGV